MVAEADMYWYVAVSGGAVWAKFASGTPVAAAGEDFLIPDGAVLTFEAAVGQRAAFVDA
jgi:hypothetical protein